MNSILACNLTSTTQKKLEIRIDDVRLLCVLTMFAHYVCLLCVQTMRAYYVFQHIPRFLGGWACQRWSYRSWDHLCLFRVPFQRRQRDQSSSRPSIRRKSLALQATLQAETRPSAWLMAGRR